MRRFKFGLSSAIAAPITLGVLIAVTGCAATAAPGSSTAIGTEPPTTTSASAVAAAPTHTLTPTGPSTTGASSAVAVSVPTSASAAFPGIWDITSWQAYRAAQASVEQGHQPWLLDPASVVRAWAASQWTTVPTVHQITADKFQLTKPGTTVLYTVRGTRPDSTGPAPIWVITAITHS